MVHSNADDSDSGNSDAASKIVDFDSGDCDVDVKNILRQFR